MKITTEAEFDAELEAIVVGLESVFSKANTAYEYELADETHAALIEVDRLRVRHIQRRRSKAATL